MYGKFSKQSAVIENLDSIKSESELLYTLKQISSNNNKNILILRFGENDVNKINSVNYLINNYQKENIKLQNKLIMFIIHKKRQTKNDKTKIKTKKKKEIIPDLIPLINDEYNQIFIDNLQGKENFDLLKVVSQQMEQLTNEYIRESNIIDNKIYAILNYIKYNIFYETKQINKNTYIDVIATKIIENDRIKEFLKKNIEKQAKNLGGLINEVYTSDILEVNDIDFFEVINSKLSNYLSVCLLKIILAGLKENIFNQLVIYDNFDLFLQNNYFTNMIYSFFERTSFNFVAKTGINLNQVTIYNGLQIPKSKTYIDKIIKYVDDEICQRFLDNENLLRIIYEDEEKIAEITKLYGDENKKFESNIQVELNNQELFKEIYNQTNEKLKKLLRDDFLKYYIIKIIEKKEINDYKINENMLNILLLIIKIKFAEERSVKNFNLNNDIEHLIKIILFTEGYKEDIMNIIDVMLDIKNYCNIEEYMIRELDTKIIQYEYSNRSKRYTKKVNYCFFNIIESLIRGVLLYSIELLKKDNFKFYEFFYTFTSIEANLQKINKKYNLYSKEIYNLISIIKIYECYKFNQEEFEKNYEKIVNNLIKQSNYLYDDNYENLYKEILNLNAIFNNTFNEKSDQYTDLLFLSNTSGLRSFIVSTKNI